MNFEYKEKYLYPTNIMLNLTDNCNLECIYCFVQQHPHYITLNTAIDAVNYIINNYNIKKEKGLWAGPGEKKMLTFFGGEPMLLFDEVIKPLIEYIEQNDNLDEFYLGITTNGTLLTKERVDFFEKYNVSILLSIDGDKETQDYNRPCKNKNQSSFELVEKNIPYLLEKYPNVTFRSTVYKNTINNLYDNFLFAESLGFRYYMCVPDVRSQNWTEQNLEDYKIQLVKISNYILSQFLNDRIPSLIFSNLDKIWDSIVLRDVKIVTNNARERKLSIERCGLGTVGCSINYKGEIFACQEQDSRETGEYFLIGDIYNGINKEKHSIIINDYLKSTGKCENEELCNNCPLKNECPHGCPSAQKDIFNDIGKVAKIYCEENQALFNIGTTIMSILVQTENEIFKNIIDKKLRSLCENKEEY